MRRMKERFEETALMKQANTRAFSKQTGEYGDDAMGRSLGLLESDTKLRKGVGEKRKTKFANTRASRKKAAQAAAKPTSGLETSVVFGPVQGMELVNPENAANRVANANKKWFSDTAGFQSALPPK